MKPLLAAVLLALSVAACTRESNERPSTRQSASSTRANPQGTDVGTSFPGVNQPTTSTTGTRSNNPTE